MNVLHYSLGLPPYRSGGLTKYSIDLMLSQQNNGDRVILFFPGHYSLKKTTRLQYFCRYHGIDVFEIVNPLPVPLLGGVCEPERFMNMVNPKNVYEIFLKKICPDIIHIHTLMGLHKEFFLAAKSLGIKVVFTTHDYYGLDTHVNLLDNNGMKYLGFKDVEKCAISNQSAYSMWRIFIMQTRSYRFLKSTKTFTLIKKFKRKWTFKENNNFSNDTLINKQKLKKYKDLGEYYTDIFSYIDLFHFNSSIAKQVYEKFIKVQGKVIPITHGGIKDQRRIKSYDKKDLLKISFLGDLDEYKGFSFLKDTLNILLKKNQTRWVLNVYGNSYEVPLTSLESDFINFKGRYSYNDLSSIFENTDVLIVPSIWKETFGFIGLEALSFGVPIVISNNVGCKDIIIDGKTGIVFNENTTELANVIENLIENRTILCELNKNICRSNISNFFIKNHAENIKSLYECTYNNL
ncbi:glycosyltransferase [Heyndrickxia acidiproducens]|uniref:glycosyltransferase n=1 Tax=Heyndrickxia acidiproducens TaxID=1121084 RepID=UPI000399D546|nr:glycosyltransferase [Heyndrickxia acidiproducens]